MSLNNIELSDLIIGEWYKDALLSSPGRTAQSAPQSAPPAGPIPAPARSAPQAPARSAHPVTPPLPASAERSIEPTPSPTLKFLGNHRRKITILVHSPGSPFLPDDQLTFLTKILEACRMNIGDVAILNTATTPVTIAELKQQLKPETILLFGLEPTAIRLPINFPVFRPQPYDECTYLSAPALGQLVQPSEEGRLLKSKLWVCLKTLLDV